MDSTALPLLRTKLVVPPPRSHIVPRQRLLASAPEAGVRLVLVEAPAGFGKTTLLASWCHALRAQGDTAVAWLTLEASENDPARFLAYLAAAVASIVPSSANAAWKSSGVANSALATLLNGLAEQGRPCVLVLDDYHLITAPAVHAAVAFLLDHLPPHICLAMSSRSEPPLPLSRLRARKELVELRAADLGFTETEANAFLEAILGHALSDEALRALHDYTEGWPAGLQLLALKAGRALDTACSAREMFAHLAGSERLVFAYLADEVFAQLPAEVQRFLLHAAVPDRLCAPLCAALLWQGADGNDEERAVAIQSARQQIAALERANMFLEPLDHERDWFRFHPLFRSFLHNRLAGEPTLCSHELHRRAATWYEEQGQTREAIGHLLAAGDTNEAAALIDTLAAPLVARGEYATLHTWLDCVPACEIEARPQLCLWAAWSALLSGEVERIAPLLTSAEARWAADEDEAHLGEVAHLRAHLARLRCEPDQTTRWAQRALAQLPPERETLHAGSLLALGAGQLLAGELDTAHTTLKEALAACQQHNELGSIVAYVCLGDLAAERGEREAAQRYYEAAIAAVGNRRLWERWWAAVRLGEIARERDQLEAATTMLEAALQSAEREGVAVYLSDGYASLARTRWAQGDGEAAARALERGLRHAQRLHSEAATRRLHALKARLALAQHDEASVQAWLAEVAPRRAGGEAALDEQEALTLARLLLAPGQHHSPNDVRTLLAPFQRRAEAQGRTASCAEASLLCALADARDGHHVHALAAMRHTLELAMPGRFLRLFLDEGAPTAAVITEIVAHCTPNDPLRTYGEQILAAFAAHLARGQQCERTVGQGDAAPWYCEPLSDRELEVLRLVAAGASNKAIAEAIVVSVGTVKSHLNHILGKLAAHSRTEAVARARTLGLLA